MNDLFFHNQKDTELNESDYGFQANSNLEEKIVYSTRNSSQNNQKIIRILIAEEQQICQQIIQSYLAPEPDLAIIGTAIDGKEAIELVEKLKPDILLMNMNLPKIDGLTVTKIISDCHVDTKILILSISEQVQDIQKSLQLGAKGYFLKSSHPQELVTAIRNIHQGYCQVGRGLIEKLDADSSLVHQKQFDSAHPSADLISQSKSEILPFQDPETALTSANSDLTLPHKQPQRLIYAPARLLILLLSGLLVFLLTPSGRKWVSQIPMFSNVQSEPAATAQDSPATTILPVETIKVNLVNSYQVDRTYTGTIVPRRTSSLGFERSGKLLSLTVDQGDRVTVGTPIALLDTRNLKAQQQELLAERKQVNALLKELQAGSRSETIAAAQSTVNSLQSQIQLARSKSKRRQELYSSGAISREQLDEATTEVNTLQARIDEAQSKLNELLTGTRPEKIEAQQAILDQLNAKLASLELELEKSILKAPFTGTIANRLVDEGTVVSAGESIFSLVEAQALEAHIGVPVSTATQIPLGSQQQLLIGSRTYQVQVLSILPQLDSATRTLTVVLGLNNSVDGEVRAGQVARLKLSETIANAGYWLPTTALVRGVRGLWSCYVLGKSELVGTDSNQIFRVERREIEVLQTGSERVFVRGMLQNNDKVIINGNHRLVTGQLVSPIETANFAKP